MDNEKEFNELWTSNYTHIWGYGECEKILGMPNMEGYGLSPQVIEAYVRKKFEISKKRWIKVGGDKFRIDEFVGAVCLILGVCGGIGLFFVSFMHPILAGICGYGVLFGIYYLTRFIVLKLDYRDYQAMKMDVIEKYLQDYHEWKRKVDKASLEANKTRGKELSEARWSNKYWTIIKEVMDTIQ